MARGRVLSRSTALSKQLAALPTDTDRLLFTWAIAHLDRDGRMTGDPALFKAQVCPLLTHIGPNECGLMMQAANNLRLVEWSADDSGLRVLRFPRFLRYNPSAARRYSPRYGRHRIDRFAILKRDGFKCEYCECPLDEHTLHVDHVVPKSRGGSDDPSNLVASCSRCNLSKGRRTPSEWRGSAP